MSIAAVLAPVFVMVAVGYAVLLRLSWTRTAALRQGGVDSGGVALGRPVWPAPAAQAGNHYINLFELPVLFFALVPLVLITRKADVLFVILEWLFVLFRVAHAGIHLTTNRVPLRGAAFMASAAVLAIAWLVFAAEILLG